MDRPWSPKKQDRAVDCQVIWIGWSSKGTCGCKGLSANKERINTLYGSRRHPLLVYRVCKLVLLLTCPSIAELWNAMFRFHLELLCCIFVNPVFCCTSVVRRLSIIEMIALHVGWYLHVGLPKYLGSLMLTFHSPALKVIRQFFFWTTYWTLLRTMWCFLVIFQLVCFHSS